MATVLQLLRAERDETDALIVFLEARMAAKAPPQPRITAAPASKKSKKKPAAGAPREEYGSNHERVRSYVSRMAGPFTAKQATDAVSAKAGKTIHSANVRTAIGLLVNTGEVKVAHEGTSKWDPTTWQATARGKKGGGEDTE
jgi:hypothetical protein